MPFGIFRFRTLTGAIIISLLLTFLTSPPAFFATLYLQRIAGASAFLTGLAFLPESLSIAVCSVLGARLTTRLGARLTMISGMSALILSMLLLAQLPVADGYRHALLPGFVVLGFGYGHPETFGIHRRHCSHRWLSLGLCRECRSSRRWRPCGSLCCRSPAPLWITRGATSATDRTAPLCALMVNALVAEARFSDTN